jgi:hypothetical protein
MRSGAGCARALLTVIPVVSQEEFDRIVPLACAWAKSQEQLILQYGAPLSPRYANDAARVGVREIDRVRVLIVDKISLPEDPYLAEVARRWQIIPDTAPAIAVGYGIAVRADGWSNRELVLHQLMHVVQRERFADTESYIREYLVARLKCAQFTIGSFEEEARRTAKEICAASA